MALKFNFGQVKGELGPFGENLVLESGLGRFHISGMGSPLEGGCPLSVIFSSFLIGPGKLKGGKFLQGGKGGQQGIWVEGRGYEPGA